MLRGACALFLVVIAVMPAQASWQQYRLDDSVSAAYDIATFSPFRGNPSVWVKWDYLTPQNGTAGMKIHFSADCRAGKLLEFTAIPYDTDGNYLAEKDFADAPVEFPVTPGSLNEATYKLLCH